MKSKYITVAGIAAFGLLVYATPALAGNCGNGEVCGLDLSGVSVNTDRTFSGLGGIDLSNVEVHGTGDIDVPVSPNITNAIAFDQTNKGKIQATLSYRGDHIVGDYSGTVDAIGNNVSVTTNGGTAVQGVQDNSGNISANASVTLLHVTSKNVDLAVTGVANNANVTGTGDLVVDAIQNNTGKRVDANADLTLMGTGSRNTAVDVAVTGIGNNFSATHDGTLTGSIVQANCADVSASANVSILAASDPVTVTAVGNNISIKTPN